MSIHTAKELANHALFLSTAKDGAQAGSEIILHFRAWVTFNEQACKAVSFNYAWAGMRVMSMQVFIPTKS